MTNIEKIILSLFLALIATIIVNFLYKIIRLYIWFVKDSYRVLSGFKKQLDSGEITVKEYKRKVTEYKERAKRGED